MKASRWSVGREKTKGKPTWDTNSGWTMWDWQSVHPKKEENKSGLFFLNFLNSTSLAFATIIMTLPKEIHEAAIEWLANNGNVECTSQNGKKELVNLYLTHFSKASSKQACDAITYLVSSKRQIICPQRTKKNLKRKDVGDNSSKSREEMKVTSSRSNPLNNPKTAKKMKTARREAAVSWHNEHAKTPALSDDKIYEVVNSIVTTTKIGDLGTLESLCKSDTEDVNFTFYVGETMRQLPLEDLRWITARGANLPEGMIYEGQRNRPVLLWNDGRNITEKQARSEGFESQIVFESAYLIDASRVEDAIQARFQHLPLGTHRLWRHVAMGRSSNKNDVVEQQVYKVFLTYSTSVVEKLHDNIWKIQT